MKTKEELNALKAEVEALNRKLRELTEEELRLVTGGSWEPLYEPSLKGDISRGTDVTPDHPWNEGEKT